MVDKINLSSRPTQATNPTPNPDKLRTIPPDGANPALVAKTRFDDLLKSELGRPPAVRFSAHAQRRMKAREIDFTGDEAVRLEQAVEKAANKGSRESLILMDDLALVVSIKNKLVITAIDANHRKENIFTNIDSVVLT